MIKLNILIVEDSPFIAATLIKIVNKLGHAVGGISDTYEGAIKQLNMGGIDMVISDIMLNSKKSGIDIGAYLQEHLKIPIIYQSSINDEAMINSAMSTGPVAYLTKPVSRADLSNALLILEIA